MYIVGSNSNGNKRNPVHYIYFLGIMSIVWITFFLLKLKDMFSLGGGHIDKLVINYVKTIRSDFISKFVVVISKSGDTIVAIIFTILVFIYFMMTKRKREGIFYALSILGVAVISQGLKFIVKRPRPVGKWLVHIGGYSFPSGHSVMSMAGALIIIYFILSNFRNRFIACIVSILVYIYASLIGLSRVYVGVHYISDVLGGWTIAYILVFIALIIYRKTTPRDETRYII